MKKARFLFVILLAAAMVFAAVPSLAEGTFSIRNGVTFGLGSDELFSLEAEKNGTDENSWSSMDLGNWHVTGLKETFSFHGYDMTLMYFLADSALQAVAYDYTLSADDETYSSVTGFLTEEYGESQEVSAEEIVTLMDCFSQGFYKASEIKSPLIWELDDLVVYQFYYNDSSFVVFFTNPAFDYTTVNTEAEAPAA